MSFLPQVAARSFSTAAATKTPPMRFRAAIKKLSKHGVEALKPQFKIKDEASQQGIWIPPAISGRVANVLRKHARRDGSYGSFEANVGGWDPLWDIELAKIQPKGKGRYTQMRVPKKTGRERTREERAQKIERKMEGMDERMEEYYAEKISKKPVESFENTYKEMMSRTK